LMVDVDYFKRVNDTHGHGAGDEVLKQVAEVLRNSVREADIPVRYGGEEFILFLVGASSVGVAEYAERIRSAIERHPCALGPGLSLSVTVSIGVAERRQHEPLDGLIRRADEALYRAKQGGRNRVERADGRAGHQGV